MSCHKCLLVWLVLRRAALSVLLVTLLVPFEMASGQTSATGAVAGVVLDPSGAAIAAASVRLVSQSSTQTRTAVSDANGAFSFPLLPPGTYRLETSSAGFAPGNIASVAVHVTETIRVELHLQVAAVIESTQVTSSALQVQLDTSALGRTVNDTAVSGLPLVTRNFTQIAGLSPGVTIGVNNAGELGSGGTAVSQLGKSNDGVYVHGSRSYDNNWSLDGISINDAIGAGDASGGIAIPNPDALEEFKVQTGQYDASFGRTAGGSISVVTKSGTPQYHGSLFEFLRNDALNANDYFLNRAGQDKPTLKQNQFGFAFGGPIRKDKVTFFSSYQATRQVNGLASGQARIGCSVTLNEPALTDDRSAQALGALFGGMRGALGGVAVQSDGSNINPVALALLNYKLPDGSYLVPTPQQVNTALPFASRGFSAFSDPCHFEEDQSMLNADYTFSDKSHLAVRSFIGDDRETVTFPGNGMNPKGNVPGFGSPTASTFDVFSISHTYVASSSVLNEARLGFTRNKTQTGASSPFQWSDIGVAEGTMNRNNELPTLNILGSLSMAPGFPRNYMQQSFSFSDVVSLEKAAHSLRVGGSIERLRERFNIDSLASSVQFLSWPDFLLGLNAAANGSAFSNVFRSGDLYGPLQRDMRGWQGSLFVQDNYRFRRTLTLNAGLRYERIGAMADAAGRNSSFDFRKADTNPPASGSLGGYVVAADFPGQLPAGVVRSASNAGTYGEGQNTIAPRLGFSWQVLPSSTRLAVRGGYGIYYSRPTGHASSLSILGAPFSFTRSASGLVNAAATFQDPFRQPFPTPDLFPLWNPYSPTTTANIFAVDAHFRPAITQQFSLNVQAEVVDGWLLEVGYVGARGLHLQRSRSLNQALDASPEHPVNGVTTNTLANIKLRVPVPGVAPDSLKLVESGGASWYNGLEASLQKHLSHGVQFLASYTFSKSLDTDGADVNGTSAGNTMTTGDQNNAHQRWGRASFDRTHRFVFSTTWEVPGPHAFAHGMLNGWAIAGIATIQSGSALTILATNSTNVFGITQDRAQLSGACSKGQLVALGSVASKLNGYFNAACFAKAPVIGADGIGTAFGNSATGLVDGPGQANVDLALSKNVPLRWPADHGSLQIRAEFFNALNHPQFANPDTSFSSATFGVINGTSVNSRVGQVALKFSF